MVETVVVVDDDDAVREAIADALVHDGYQIVTARDGDEALRVLRTTPRPCLALIDLVMPRLDGWELARAIASTPSLCDIGMICTTAGRDGLPPGCFALLRKPFDDRALSETVKAAFAEMAHRVRV